MVPVALLWAMLLASGGVVLWQHRQALRLEDAALLLGALAVRLWWVPALERHLYDGHEAEHLAWFLDPAAGGAVDTLAYPLMQGWWRAWGALLPADERLPVLLSALTGALGVVSLGGGVRILAGRAAGIVAGCVAALHPTHAAWSSSAYNVILPNTLGALAVLGAALAARGGGGRAAPWMAASALGLAVAGRLEMILYLLPCAGLIAGQLGRGGGWLAAGLAGGGLAAWAVWPVIAAGPLPGEGERWLSWTVNLPLFVFHDLLRPWWSLLAVVVLAAGAVVRWPREGLALLPLVLVNHVVMSSFDDYGVRHTLPGLVSLCFAVGAGAAAWGRWRGGVLLAAVGLAALADMTDLRERYYGPEEAFLATLQEDPWRALPRIERPPGVEAGCGWIAEDPRVASVPARSHFNLLSAEEAEALRGPGGCLHWCMDVQDWRWSSRGVRDRALRLSRLYALQPVAVVVEQGSGYACLVVRVGARRPAGFWGAVGWHARRHSADPGVP